jgi:uncharacterized protein YuzE
MRIRYDAEADALSIIFMETTVTTRHLAEGIAADFDQEGRLSGLEVLDAAKRLGGRDTFRKISLEGMGSPYPAVREEPPAGFEKQK